MELSFSNMTSRRKKDRRASYFKDRPSRSISTIFLVVFISFTLPACVDEDRPTKEEYEELEEKYYALKDTVRKLRNTPVQRLSRGQDLKEQERYQAAIDEFEDLISEYPNSSQAEKAKRLKSEIERIQKRKKQKKLERKRKGFKVLEASNRIELDEMTLVFSSIDIRDRWVYDRYRDRYHYQDAERGNSFIEATTKVYADVKEPKLPPIQAFVLKDGKLKYKGTLDYRFYRWEDYGSYLGNTVDYNNKFTHSESVTFSVGLEVEEKAYKGTPVFLFVKDEECFERTSSMGQPEVEYENDCYTSGKWLDVKEAQGDNYRLVHIFNRRHL